MRRTNKLHRTVRWTIAMVLVLASAAGAEDWPQAAANAARTCHVTDEPAAPYELAWQKDWPGQAITNTNQPIMVAGVLYVGSNHGPVHAVKLADGQELWTADLPAGVSHALACDGQRVFAAALDGAVYALDVKDGKTLWRSPVGRRGITAAPLLMDGRLFVGSRDGAFACLEAQTGKQLWRMDCGQPIVHTAAGADGKVVFGDEGMILRCLRASDGQELWRHGPIFGQSFRDYWPVIHQGKVVVRMTPAPRRALTGSMVALQKRLTRATTIEQVLAEQDIFVKWFREYPQTITCRVYELEGGREPYITSIVRGAVSTGTPPPPVLGGDGQLYTLNRTSAATNGVTDICHLILGRLDLETGKFATPFLCGWKQGVDKLVGVRSPFKMISDESCDISSGGNLIFGIRVDHGCGAVHVKTRQTWTLPDPPLWRRTDMQAAGNLIAISGKYVAYVACGEVVCIRGR